MPDDHQPSPGGVLLCAAILVGVTIAAGFFLFALLLQGRIVVGFAALGVGMAALVLAAYLVARSGTPNDR